MSMINAASLPGNQIHTNGREYPLASTGLGRVDLPSSGVWLRRAGRHRHWEFPAPAGRQADDFNLRIGEPAQFTNTQRGARWWIVALVGEVVGDDEKFGALEREIIGECL